MLKLAARQVKYYYNLYTGSYTAQQEQTFRVIKLHKTEPGSIQYVDGGIRGGANEPVLFKSYSYTDYVIIGMSEYFGKNPEIHIWHDRGFRMRTMFTSAGFFMIWMLFGNFSDHAKRAIHGGHHQITIQRLSIPDCIFIRNQTIY